MQVEMVKGIDPKILADLYSQFDTTTETLSRLKWHLPKEMCIRDRSDLLVEEFKKGL